MNHDIGWLTFTSEHILLILQSHLCRFFESLPTSLSVSSLLESTRANDGGPERPGSRSEDGSDARNVMGTEEDALELAECLLPILDRIISLLEVRSKMFRCKLNK